MELPVIAHAQCDHARWQAVLRLQVGGIDALRQRLADAHQRIEMSPFGALQEAFADQVGVAVAILPWGTFLLLRPDQSPPGQ